MFRHLIRFLFLACFSAPVLAQDSAMVKGIITDDDGKPAVSVLVGLNGTSIRTYSLADGSYQITVPARKNHSLTFLKPEYPARVEQIPMLSKGEIYQLNTKLIPIRSKGVVVNKQRERNEVGVIDIDPKSFRNLPSPNKSFEALLKTLGPVASNNELSSQYNVRGGNYDENLVYVNDIEIYRPQLVRSGQQEGLSFINPDLVQSVSFSAGGFGARYGDKMSSVLDVKYKTPRKFASSVSLSALGATAHLEGNYKVRFSYLIGVRHRTNQYLLNSLDVSGDYKPRFTDVQGLFTYRIRENLNIQWLSNFAINSYFFVPQDRVSAFGTVTNALQLTVFYNGKEEMRYRTFTNALTLNHQSERNKNLNSKYYVSAYDAVEQEMNGVGSAYSLDQLENDLGKPDFGKVKFNRGVGYFLENSRNELFIRVLNAGYKANYTWRRDNQLYWGVQAQQEIIDDRLREWKYIDSFDYSIPFVSSDKFDLNSFYNSRNQLNSFRYSAYVQSTQVFGEDRNWSASYGVRGQYWTLNKQPLVSPRAQLSWEPNKRRNDTLPDSLRKWDIVFKAASGVYYQSPFYREMRAFDGTLNTNLKAQRSIHFVVGADYQFMAFGRPFRLFSELYYKKLDFLVPYEIDNVRIRYYAENSAKGYIAGFDNRIAGQFIEGVESWASISLMRAREDLLNDSYVDENGVTQYPGYIPRPTDQLVNFAAFFQDNLRNVDRCRIYTMLVFGSPLPYGPPDYTRYKDTLRTSPYRRVDVGFSWVFIDEDHPGKKPWMKPFRNATLSLELFNLFDINNTISYTWVKDYANTTYGVPVYLTSRRVNLQLYILF